jgi:hypothetical protein
VTRQFDLSVYATDGRLTGEYPFSTHTKSPVHLVAGFLADRYILGAATKGGVWLVAPGEGVQSTRTIHPEFHRDATVLVRMSTDGLRATLVYESGKAALLELDASQNPILRPLADRDVLYAGFAPGRSDLILSTAVDGVLRAFEIDDRGRHEILHSDSTGAVIDWVSFDPETNRYAVVGSDFRIHILDGASGSLLETVDFAEAVDWRDDLAVAVTPPTQVEPGPLWEPGNGIPLTEMPVAALEQAGGETWIVTEAWPNEYLPEYTVHRTAHGFAHRLAPGCAPIRSHGDLVVLGGGLLKFEGRAFYRNGQELCPFPADGAAISAVLEKDGVVWLGTANGGYIYEGHRFNRVTPANLDVSTITDAGGRVWLGGKNGAYTVDRGRLIRATAPFLQVKEIRDAGGRVWIIGEEDMSHTGPVYRVDGWFSRPLPRHDAKEVVLLRNVGGEDDDVWLSESHALHRVRGMEIRSVAIDPAVAGIARIGRTIWMTTQVRNVFPFPGPIFRMDAETLTPVRLDVRGLYLARAGDLLFVVHPDDSETGFAVGGSVSLLSETDSRLLDLGTGSLQRIVVVAGRTWLLTSDAAFVMDGDRPMRVASPSLSYLDAQSVDGEAWLLTSGGAVRMRGDTPVFYDTQGNAAREVRTVGGEQWILTGDSLRAGPAFRVRGDRCRAETPDGAGVATVVTFDDALWMLTRRDGRAGPMVRVDPRKSGSPAGPVA